MVFLQNNFYMSALKITNLRDIPCKLYGPNDEYIGEIVNTLQFTDVRVQIKKRKLSGCYIVFGKEKIRIDKHGMLEKYPKGLFDIEYNLLDELLDLK